MTTARGYETWRLDPRDPLVFGRGGRTPLSPAADAPWLPPQATVAGLVRTTLGGGGTTVRAEDALRLLDVRIRGPWLVELREGGASAPWVPLPADCALGRDGDVDHLIRGSLFGPATDEGTSAARDGLPQLAAHLPERWNGEKTRSPEPPFRPLEWVIDWSLDDAASRPWKDASLDEGPPVVAEPRVHVGIDDASLTAEPEVLFGSAGVRFLEGFGLAVEVARDGADDGAGSSDRLLVLGGEARVSILGTFQAGCFPAFEVYEPRIVERIRTPRGKRLGLRVQLLTPAAFGGWRPEAWPGDLADLPLLAATLPRFEAISGWDLQHRQPRKVRRLVPAGAVYTFGPIEGDRLHRLCRDLWGRSICEGIPGEPNSFLAAPANDGYGTVLPLPCALPEDSA